MKTRLLSLMAMTAVLVLGSCSYDDTDLKNRVGELEEKVTALQQTVDKMNTNLQALQAVVDVINSGDYIKSISEVMAGDEVVGYTFTFGKKDPITIYNGEDGEDGKTPAISVTVGTDGKYYWTIDGEIMKDAAGNPVSAAGVTPLLRINNGVWQYSTDNGNTWENVTVEGYAGVVIKSVNVEEDSVTLELADGSTLSLPRLTDFALEFSKTSYYVANGVEFNVAYTIKGADDQTSIVVFPSGDVTVTLTKESVSAGTMKVVKGAEQATVQVLVLASNGKGQKDYEIINFNELEFSCTAVDVALEAAGASASLEITSNVTYTVVIPEDATWLTYEHTAAESGTGGTLVLTAAENPLRLVRSAEVEIVDEYGYVIETITVAQAAADYQSGGQIGDIPVMPA